MSSLDWGAYQGTYDGKDKRDGAQARIGRITDYNDLEAAIRDDLEEQVNFGEGWLANLRPEDVAIVPDIVNSPMPPEVQSFDETQTLLPMDGDEYPTIAGEGFPATTRAFGRVATRASETPTLLKADESFTVSVQNTDSTAEGTGTGGSSGS